MKDKVVFSVDVNLPEVNSCSLLSNSKQKFEFVPVSGEHTFTTDLIPFSNAFGVNRVGMELKIPYSYFPDKNSIFLCGAGYSGINHNSVVLKNMENNEIIGECKNNKYGDNSKDHIDFYEADTFDAIRGMLNDISEKLVKMAEEKGLMVYVRRDLINSEDEETFSDIGLLIKDGEFIGFYDSGTECDETYTRIPVTSVAGGTVLVTAGTRYWNVRGSTGDPNPDGTSWLDFWVNKSGGHLEGCTTNGCINFNNTNRLVGGHVVFNAADVKPAYGEDGKVAILPICRNCNNFHTTGEMAAGRNITAVWLNDYHK